MNHEDIIAMAREAGLDPDNLAVQFLERFAALVAAAVRKDADYRLGLLIHEEREACAKVCESLPLEWEDQPNIAQTELATMMDCALAIRARGKA